MFDCAKKNTRNERVFPICFVALSLLVPALALRAQTDPGVRGGPAGAGAPLPGLTTKQSKFFDEGRLEFLEQQSVRGTISNTEAGLGPRFNMDSCGGCHLHPAVGGTSPSVNPQVAVATRNGATNTVPFFVTLEGPVREARFKYNSDMTRDGGVHALYTITGRTDAAGCNIAQPDFVTAAAQNNLIFRIPTPTFGAGLIEAIPDFAILANKAVTPAKSALGISGHENREGNTGTITRFGWKAQNKSLLIFSSEAYNVEQGVTNEGFPQERDETSGCRFNQTPEDHTEYEQTNPLTITSGVVNFSNFMRFLAPPAPVSAFGNVSAASIVAGRDLFVNTVGCALCHTPSLQTGTSPFTALNNKPVNLFSDLLVHHMGSGLADDIIQGNAGPDEFRTAPLWGLGQRIFFLHDGRTLDLLEAILAHESEGSEANGSIAAFKGLAVPQKQDILNFLRSL